MINEYCCDSEGSKRVVSLIPNGVLVFLVVVVFVCMCKGSEVVC